MTKFTTVRVRIIRRMNDMNRPLRRSAGMLAAVAAVATLAAQTFSPYKLIPNWGMLPAGMEWTEVPAAAVDAKDTILVFRRDTVPIFVFDRAGNLVKQWGQG